MATSSMVRTGRFPTLLENFFKPWNEWIDTNGGFWGKMQNVPAVNIVESDDRYTVFLAAPGMKKDDFKIDVDGNILTISSEREERKEEKEKHYTRREYNFSSFSRSFTMPEEVNKENIEARYEDGTLKLVLPIKDGAKKLTTKHIAVK